MHTMEGVIFGGKQAISSKFLTLKNYGNDAAYSTVGTQEHGQWLLVNNAIECLASDE